MNKLSSLSYGLLLSASVALIGCGGGGGSSGSKPTTPPASSAAASSVVASSIVASSVVASSVVVTSSIAPSSSAAASSSAPANMQLTIQGVAAAEALAGGEVVFTIGSKTYKAPIDNALKYNMLLDVPAQDSSAPFVAVATGSAGNSWVQLARLYPSVKSLVEKAGSDKVLNAEEYSGLTITPLSTAEYAEIKSKQFPFATDEERTSALFSLHPIRALEQAAMVERLLTDVDIHLPAQTKTTLDYLLNANLAETHLEALRVTNESTLNDSVAQIQADPLQANVPAEKIIGNYFLEALNANYYLTLNADGTGTLTAATLHAKVEGNSAAEVVTNFTWVRTGNAVSLTLNELTRADIKDIYTPSNTWATCDDYNTLSEIEACDVRFNEIQLDLITKTENHYLANLKILVTFTRKNNGAIVYEGALDPQLARVLNVENLVAINRDALIGAELVGVRYSYVFNSNGTVKQKDLHTQIETTRDWTLEKNRVVIGDSQFWVSHKTHVGFGVYSVDDKRVSASSLWRRTSVNMAESDWIGRWSTFPKEAFGAGSLYDVNEDKSWRDGFEGQLAGSWSIINGHRQTALANGSWRMIRDMVSIQGDKYYLSICQGEDATPFVPSACYLDIEQKSTNFDTAVFWKNWSHPAFNEKATDEPLVSIWGYLLNYDKYKFEWTNKAYYPVAANKLFSRSAQTILEMTSAGRNEIELCEYQLNDTCNEANKHTYVRGIEVKLNVGAGGEVTYSKEFKQLDWNAYLTFNPSIDKVFMVPKSMSQIIKITPDTGYVLDSVTGCEGHLNGYEYYIPGLTATCEISVSFTKI
ncbi:MAG TPA: hypothetical protein VLC79_13380 [Cellvibrio sp.]|nr:hypothetical protein [Cellvibrio sp.]